MKKIVGLVALVLLFITGSAWAPVPGKGSIVFIENNWSQVLKKAKAEKKLIFLDISASWCGPCKMLKRETFTDSKVASYFNSHFINAAFDGEVGDGVMLAKKYNLRAYPSLFLLDAEGNIVSQSVGYMDAQQLLNFGQQAGK